jgi:hypothetical protein
MTRLDEAIEALYASFSGYQCDKLEDVDEHVRDDLADQLTAVLCNSDLRSLSQDQLFDYYYLAVDHIGTSENLRYFLPRILELIAREPSKLLAPPLLPDVLRRAAAGELDSSKKEALTRFFASLDGIVKPRIINGSLETLNRS